MNKTIILLSVIVSLFVVIAALLVNSKTPTGTPGDETKEQSWVGKKAPDFELEDFDGNKVALTNLKGKNVVLFFSEGLMCYPACWDQMGKLGSDSRFNDENTVSYSIIMDKKNDWQQAFNKMPELKSAKVLFDVYGTVSKTYKALDLDSSMHRGRFPGHTYFVIDKGSTIRYFFDDPQMGLRNDQIYEELKKI